MAESTTLKAIEPPLVLVLVSPQIPPNTGNVARLCAVTGCKLLLVEPLGFSIADKELKRAGLDYWDKVFLKLFSSWEEYVSASPGVRRWLFTARTEGERPRSSATPEAAREGAANPTRNTASALWDVKFAPGDHLVFGSETQGLPAQVLESGPNVTLPMLEERRSLNLSTAVGIAAYEALRQLRG